MGAGEAGPASVLPGGRRLGRPDDWLGASGHGNTPFMLGEYGTVDDRRHPGRKATWFDPAVSQLGNFPNLRALVYFDRDQDCDWRVTSGPGSLEAYRGLAAAVG